MSGYLTHSERWRHHQQPRRIRVDYSRPGWTDPRDPAPDDTEETTDEA